ncbi:MAG: hypothetical protein ABEK16_05630 [Candidatus Nanohalobium sp.]
MSLLVDFLTFNVLLFATRTIFIWGGATVVLSESSKGKAAALAGLGSFSAFIWSFLPVAGGAWPILLLVVDFYGFKDIYGARWTSALVTMIMIGIIQGGLYFLGLLVIAPLVAPLL